MSLPLADVRLDGRHVIIVEDEPSLADIVRDYFASHNMRATILSDGTDAVCTIMDERPDLVILDIMLPGRDGLDICRDLRRRTTVPIMFVTAKVEEIDRLIGLEIGADDYICKPFSPRELVARAKAVLRRTGDHPGGPEKSRLVLDAERWTVTVDGTPVDFTRREFCVLQALCGRPGRVFSRAQLLDIAYPDNTEVIDRTIDSHIKNIRNKIKTVTDWEAIRSVYGVGYAFED